jgi:hypothetical protein
MPVQQICAKCRKERLLYIDKKTEVVFCSECETEFPASYYLKTQLKTLQQYKPKVQVPFQIKCNSCNKEGTPVLDKDKLICFNCRKQLQHLTEHFKLAVKNFLK